MNMKDYQESSGDCADSDTQRVSGIKTQWATNDDLHFYAVGRTVSALKPGAFEVINDDSTIVFKSFPIITNNLTNFPDTISNTIVDEAFKFWERTADFDRFKMAHRRGFLICGPAGCGKSSIIKLVCQETINRGGIIIPFCNPKLLVHGITLIRSLQPDTPIVVTMEDLDAIIANTDESYLMNILDGGLSYLNKIIWLATTNYPELLKRRVTNRPKRFDNVFVMKQPCAETRRMALTIYMERATDDEKAKFNIDTAVNDSEGLSFSALDELVTSVILFNHDYAETIERLKSMTHSELPTGDMMESNRGHMGFKGEGACAPRGHKAIRNKW